MTDEKPQVTYEVSEHLMKAIYLALLDSISRLDCVGDYSLRYCKSELEKIWPSLGDLK